MKRLLTSVICSLVGLHTILGVEPARPRLVVGIMVDQLRTDYLEFLKTNFSEGGFRRLMQNGVYLKDVNFKVSGLDRPSGTAIIYTGSYPRYNGITASKVYNPQTKDMVPALKDATIIGNFTDETYSPGALRLSTLSDELAIALDGEGRIHSIAADPQQSIIMAGHAGNSAFWINENTGKWASTTYYHDAPNILPNRNYSNSITQRIDTIRWTPLRPSENYNPNSKSKKKNSGDFIHSFSLSDRDVFSIYTSSPFINEDITDAAISYLKDLALGSNSGSTDMLNLAYTVAPFTYGIEQNFTSELEDIYLRLDLQLNRLFKAINDYVGLDNTLIYVSSTGYYDDPVADDLKYGIPSGTFSVKRALSLLNSFLSAQFGNAAYVDTYSGGHIYLDRKVIEEKQLNLKDVSEISRDFLVRMSGVNDAFTMGDIMSSALPLMEGIRLGTDPKTGGDIILEFNAGWTIVNDLHFPNDIQVARSTPVLTPVFILGKDVSPSEITATIDAVAIAPTIAQIMRIRSPNGAQEKPLILK